MGQQGRAFAFTTATAAGPGVGGSEFRHAAGPGVGGSELRHPAGTSGPAGNHG